MTDTNRITGRIIKVSKTGWGFISSKDIQFTRIFFHWTALTQDSIPFLELKTGQPVEFTPIQIPGKGWRGVHVRVSEREKHYVPEPEPEVEFPTETEVPPLPEQ